MRIGAKIATKLPTNYMKSAPETSFLLTVWASTADVAAARNYAIQISEIG